MAPMSQEDLEWFKSTFHPIPRPQLPEDAIEYSLYLIPSDPAPAVTDAVTETRARLQEVQKSASELSKKLLKDYIWQREGFGLEITKENGITLLRGRTNYGDSIEDEWVIVYILRELTKKHKDLWVKVIDSDGEFLLIEAAGSLPSWLEPDVADNRVWIHNGQLVIIKPKHDRKRVTEKISLEDARKIIVEEPKRLMRSPMIEEEAFYRLRNYPQQINENMHTALVTIPRKIAYLLHQRPAYISPAVEAFYTRDPIALRPLKAKGRSNLTFPPEDFVTVGVRFTRVGYAQLKSQDFPAPHAWIGKLPPTTDRKAYARAETGMKVTCGFEMFISDPQNQDKPAVREMKLLLEDIDTGDEKLPTDAEIEKWDRREDDEKWLDISYDDLEGELRGKARDGSAKPGAFGDQSAQENLQRIVARFEEFLNDDSADIEGAHFLGESDTDDDDELSSDGEDKELSFDEEEFSNAMKEMMGMPSGSRPRRPNGRVEELDSESEEDDSQEIEELSRQMEAELRPTGVLDLNRRAANEPAGKAKSVKGKAPMRTKESPDQGDISESEVDAEADEDVNINLAKNLLESLQSQAGMPGPGGNLLGMMGMKMPRDDRG
ncbi:hypothetical protein VTN77DRAFT_3099 [Rasamsonia byssochlamydoides]|uniref:uncharacterized protein n=1 Tax=Rasamsonia byssochlamydoides TaxID=89139 RepID=UPI003744AB07